jgi:hypothetical protein
MERPAVRVRAPGDHRPVEAVERTVAAAVSAGSRRRVSSQASATLSGPALQDAGRNHVRPTAIASAKPARDMFALWAYVVVGTCRYGQATKSLANDALNRLAQVILSTRLTLTNSTVLESAYCCKRGLIYGS